MPLTTLDERLAESRKMEDYSGRAFVSEVWPFCVVAGEEVEMEIKLRNNKRPPGDLTASYQMFFMHKDIIPQPCILDIDQTFIKWTAQKLSPGVLNIVMVFETEEGIVSSVTPVPVLPSDAAKEMTAIFEKTLKQETKSDLLLSPGVPLSEAQESAIREAIWHDHIRSFAVDLDFLLSDMDDEGDDNAISDEAMDDALLKVFRSLFQFLKEWNAHSTIAYLIEACKERGVISFYSEYKREDNLRSETPSTLYEMAPRPSNEDDDAESCEGDNNKADDPETSEFYSNFGFRHSSDNNEVSYTEIFTSFQSFDDFVQAGTFDSQVDREEHVDPLPSPPPSIPSPNSNSTGSVRVRVAKDNMKVFRFFFLMFLLFFVCLVLPSTLEQLKKSDFQMWHIKYTTTP